MSEGIDIEVTFSVDLDEVDFVDCIFFFEFELCLSFDFFLLLSFFCSFSGGFLSLLDDFWGGWLVFSL